MKLALWGAGGFLGGAILKASESRGMQVILPPRVEVSSQAGGADPVATVRNWFRDHPEKADEVARLLSGADVVINAAGLAEPEGTDPPRLIAANTVLPGVIAGLTVLAEVPRMIHISSAAVQGSRDPLDETAIVQPFSPYSSSKAAGEKLLSQSLVDVPGEVMLYRPTSVQGTNRGITRSLVRLASVPILPLPGGGEAPVPVCLVQNVAAGILHAAQMQRPCPPIVLQPWEGMTIRSLLEAFGGRSRFVPIPAGATALIIGSLKVLLKRSSSFRARLRRMELLARGQSIDATVLRSSGFRPEGGFDEYRRLAERVREEAARH
jgi:UDP-glucose 4-epimerase